MITMKRSCRGTDQWLLSVGMAVVLSLGAASAQVWQVVPQNVQLDAYAETTGGFGGPCTLAPPPMVGLQQPFGFHDMGQENVASCREIGSCVIAADGDARIEIDGVGTSVLRIRWDGMSQTHHSCFFGRAYTATGTASLLASLGLTPVGLPNGTAVTVDFLWFQGSTNNFHPELVPPEDVPTSVLATSLSASGIALFPAGFFNLNSIRAAGFRNDIGSFPAIAGVEFLVNVSFSTSAYMENPGNPPPPGTLPEDDDELTSDSGWLILSLIGPLIPSPGNGEIDFSVDMGSDTSMAPAPVSDGNEVFDPGDMYPLGGPVLPAGGQSGVRDDAGTFGNVDPPPIAPGIPVASACSGAPVPPTDAANFDADGADSLDAATLATIQNAIQGGGPFPIPYAPSSCVRTADFLLLSFDDDTTSHVYAAAPCSAPATSQSPTGQTYGSLALQDEIVGANVLLFNGQRHAVTYPVASETQTHLSLLGNPVAWATVAQQAPDDDVDALDERMEDCDIWLFSVDHEANLQLDPATIYQAAFGGPIPLITGAQLGLPPGVDLRDFELAVTTGPAGNNVLVLLFTVAPDDPLTAVDESGGRDPARIYASYLNGFDFWFLADPIPLRVSPSPFPVDGIDALTAVPQPFSFPAGDSDADGVVDAQDCAPFDPTAFRIPFEVPGLTIAPPSATLSWDSLAATAGFGTVYDLIRGSVTQTGNVNIGAAICLANDWPNTTFFDNQIPASKTAFLYLVRGQNVCGSGSYGTSSNHNLRVNASCP